MAKFQPGQRTIRFSKKSAIKLGDWDLKRGGFQNICQIKPRLNYQLLFGKMSPHSSPQRSGWTRAISHLSSGRIKDGTRETAEIKPNKTKKADYFVMVFFTLLVVSVVPCFCSYGIGKKILFHCLCQ